MEKIDFTTTLKEYLNKDSSQGLIPNSNIRMNISAALLPSEVLSNFKLSAKSEQVGFKV